jgi:hypothetical protein
MPNPNIPTSEREVVFYIDQFRRLFVYFKHYVEKLPESKFDIEKKRFDILLENCAVKIEQLDILSKEALNLAQTLTQQITINQNNEIVDQISQNLGGIIKIKNTLETQDFNNLQTQVEKIHNILNNSGAIRKLTPLLLKVEKLIAKYSNT